MQRTRTDIFVQLRESEGPIFYPTESTHTNLPYFFINNNITITITLLHSDPKNVG